MTLASIELPNNVTRQGGVTCFVQHGLTASFEATVAPPVQANTFSPALSSSAAGAVSAAIASMRVKANLENGLAAALDQNRIRAFVLADIEALLDFALSGDQLRVAIAAQLAKLPAALSDIDEQYHRRNALVFSQQTGTQLESNAGLWEGRWPEA